MSWLSRAFGGHDEADDDLRIMPPVAPEKHPDPLPPAAPPKKRKVATTKKTVKRKGIKK